MSEFVAETRAIVTDLISWLIEICFEDKACRTGWWIGTGERRTEKALGYAEGC